MNDLKAFLILFLFFLFLLSYAQPNCNLYENDTKCHGACLELEKATMHYSGDASFQRHLLNAIEWCPEFHQAYFELSVNYAKRGLIQEWKTLIDKAVEISPVDHLGWRGWYHWFFMNNYESAIADVDRLDALTNYDMGTTGDGLYHLNVLKGLCYKGLGNNQKALQTIENAMQGEEYYQGAYDYLHLGVLHLELNQPLKALDAFDKQNAFNEISEAYFYSAKAKLQLGYVQQATDLLHLALEAYDTNLAMHDPYRQLPDEIYLADIESAIEKIKKGQ